MALVFDDFKGVEVLFSGDDVQKIHSNCVATHVDA
jgi:hypothetical protein